MVRALCALGLAVVGLAAQGATAASPPTGPATAKAFAAITGARDDARSGDPEQVQRRYEVAREVADGLAAITPTPPCRPLYEALAAAAHGSILATEGFDRGRAALRLGAERTVAAAITAYEGGIGTCPGGIRAAGRPTTGRDPLLAPLAAEAFFGEIQLAVPRGTRQLDLLWRGRPALRLHDPPAGTQTLRLPDTSAAGRGTLALTVRSDRGTTRARVENVWLLPAGTRRAVIREHRDPGLNARLAALASGFPGFAGIYVHDMTTGRTASWNAEARFPAASTVKLGVLAAALDRYGPRPERSPAFYDMQALAGWSSNLAANRLLRLLGSGDLSRGRHAVEAKFRRLGAARSTYPGAYRVGTARAAVPRGPPLVSARTTTAADLGRMLVVLQAAAAGNVRAQRAAGLSGHEARIGIALLLDSEPAGENVGLFRTWLPKGMAAAQKHGWIAAARHSVAVVYGPRGPVVVALVTYRDGLALRDARHLGRQVVRAAPRLEDDETAGAP